MATHIWTGGGVGGSASTILNWDTGSAPTTGDIVIYDGAFPVTGTKNCTWDIDGAVNLNSLTISSGYTGTITNLTRFQVTNAAPKTITFDGGVWNWGGGIIHLTGVLDASQNATKTITCSNSTIICNSSCLLDGVGLTFNKNTGTVQFGGDGFMATTAGVTLNNFTPSASVVLKNDVTVTGTLLLNSAIVNSFNLISQGDVSGGGSSQVSTGTTGIQFQGGSNQTLTGNNEVIQFDTTINKSAGTLTLAGTIRTGFTRSSTWTYTAGTVDPGTSILKPIGGTTTLNLSGMSLFDLDITGGTAVATSTLDINGAINIAGTFEPGANTVNVAGNWTKTGTFTRATSTINFDGTSTLVGNTSFNALTFTASSVNLASSANFVAASTFTANGGGASNLIVLSATTAGQRAIFRVSGGQAVSFVSATDMDSSGGNTVSNASGTTSNTINWTIPAPVIPATDTLSYIFMVA